MLVLWTVCAIVAIGLFPSEAYAWGPAAHLNLGLQILDQVSLLPSQMQALLTVHKLEYLYGCISADITLGKKYFISYHHHCHNWRVGLKLLESAQSDRSKACMLGYLSHLAADTIAHNLYVPLKNVEDYASTSRGHLYWELMFDREMSNARILDMIYAMSKNPFQEEDALLQKSLKPTIFSFATNKRIFNGLLILQRFNKWQQLMERMDRTQEPALTSAEVKRYETLCLNATLSFLIDRDASSYLRLDPSGEHALKRARELVKQLRRQGGDEGRSQAMGEIESSFATTLQGKDSNHDA